MDDRARRGFHWGVAGSAFQSEGDMPPCNWRVYLSDGKHPGLEPYHDSVDFRNRYREDIALAKSLGAEVFRFGVSWARVEPEEGVIDDEGWVFYRDVVSAITEAGMEPMPTLDHFVYPEWIFHHGGWLNTSTVSVLMETKMPDLAPPQSSAMPTNLVRAHRHSYELIKAANNDALVSSNEATGNLPLPARADADGQFLDQVAETHLDFIGLDLYYPDITAEGMARIDRRTPWLVPQPPDGVGPVAEYYTNKYFGLPVFIIETGMPTDNGAARPYGLTRSQQLLNAVGSIRRAR